MGKFMLYDGGHDNAIKYLKISIQYYEEMSDGKYIPGMGEAYLYLGEAYFAKKYNVNLVEEHYLKALEIFT